MLAELILTLGEEANDLGFWQSSLFHGVMMEQIDAEYGAFLHQNGWKPYSQFLERSGDHLRWHICTLQKEAFEKIILPLEREDFSLISIKKKDKTISILDKELRVQPKRQLMEEFYNEPAERYLNIQILTPAAFKSSGYYQIIPDTRLIFQSLMNKYSSVSDTLEMFDEETLDALSSCSQITSYRLNSTAFPLEGVKIPSFRGNLTIRINGAETLARYARMLVKFGEFSGLGIKTALGMGAIKRIERGEKKHDRSGN